MEVYYEAQKDFKYAYWRNLLGSSYNNSFGRTSDSMPKLR